MGNKAQLADILTFHVLPEQVLSTDLKTYQRVATVEGKHLDVIKSQKGVHVGADIKSLKKVVGADLADTLSSPGPFTVFAPTNEAFGALPEGTLDTLLKPENKDQLVDILTYHVLPAQVLSTDLKFFQRVATVEGKNVHVVKTSTGVYVGPSARDLKTVVGADNLASNGVAHIIDGVLLPPADSVVV